MLAGRIRELLGEGTPDGRRVAFERGGAVFSVSVAGGKPRRLIDRAREPSWSR